MNKHRETISRPGVLFALLLFILSGVLFTGITPAVSRPGLNPSVLKMTPENGAQDIDLNAPVKVQFSEPMDPKSLNEFTLFLSDSVSQVSGKILYDNSNRTLEFKPYSALTSGCTYRMVVSKDVKSQRQLSMVSDAAWIFTTKNIDVIRPLILSADPGPDAWDIDVDFEVTILFSEALDQKSINIKNFSLYDNDQRISVDLDYNPTAKTVKLRPAHNLKFSSQYTVSVALGIKDLAGNTMAREVQWNVNTRPAPDTQEPKLISSVPWNNAEDVPLDTPIELVFNEPLMEKDINAFNIHFRDSTDVDIAGLVYYDKKVKTIRFSPAYSLKYGSEYTVTVDRAIRDLSGNNFKQDTIVSFSTGIAPDETAPVIVNTRPGDRDKKIDLDTDIRVYFSEPIKSMTINEFTVGLSDGEYRIKGNIKWVEDENMLIFKPTEKLRYDKTYIMTVKKGVKDLAGNDLNQGIVFSFRTVNEPDKTAPRLIFSSPNVGEADVAINALLEIYFDEHLKKESINLFSIRVSEKSGKKVFGKVKYSEKDSKVVFKPNKKMAYDTVYTVKIKDIKDRFGNTMLGEEVWTFRTVHAPDSRGPEIVYRRPENKSSRVDPLAKVKIKFNEPLNILTINEFTLSVNDGAVNLKCDIDHEQAENTVYLNPRYPMDYDKVYWITVKNGICDIAGNKMKEDVKWSFHTIEPPDLIQPRIIEVWPESGRGGIDPNANVVITFSEPLNPLSVNETTFVLKAGPRVVKSKVKWDESRLMATVYPLEPLDYGVTYTVNIYPNVQDMAGNNLDDIKMSSFKTITRQKIAGLDLEKGYSYFETNPFPDISKEHWSYNAIRELARKGYIQGRSNNLFKGSDNASRYEVALTLKRIIDNVNIRKKLDHYDALLIEKLITEFSSELNLVGARIYDFQKSLRYLGLKVKDTAIEVQRAKMKVEELKKKAALQKQIDKYRRMAAMALVLFI